MIYHIEELLKENGFRCGRMISYSKKSPEGCFCVWNANIITKSNGKVWFGDLNITREGNKLKEVAKQLGEELFVLREMDCRFETSTDSIEVLIDKAVWHTNMEIP